MIVRSPASRWKIYDRLTRHRFSYWLFSTVHPTQRRLRSRESTALVIEGFPRSGNTYAVLAFEASNPDLQLHISHHTHSIANIRSSVRWNVPVMLLVRRPSHAVRSLCARYPGLSEASALRSYIDFHQRLLPLLDKVYVVKFEMVTGDFATVVDGLNRRYGTSFGLYHATGDTEQLLMDKIEEVGRGDAHGRSLEHQVSRPSAAREAMYAVALPAASQAAPGLHTKAEAVYRNVLGDPGEF